MGGYTRALIRDFNLDLIARLVGFQVNMRLLLLRAAAVAAGVFYQVDDNALEIVGGDLAHRSGLISAVSSSPKLLV